MVVPGINEGYNASAAIIKDSKVVACASEKRFTKIENDVGYALHAIESADHKFYNQRLYQGYKRVLDSAAGVPARMIKL